MRDVPVARILGVEIRLHPSWILILALIAVTVVDQLAGLTPDVAEPLRWAGGALVGLGFLASAVAHELGHAVVARRHGLDVPAITVYFVGGTAAFEPESDDPAAEARIAVAGPLVSLAIGTVLALAALGLAALGPALRGPAAGLAIVAALNVALGLVQAIPAYPLDGARLARAIAWRAGGDPRRATRTVARTGRLVGWGLLGLGMTIILLAEPLDGVLVGAAGWFLASTASQVERRAALERVLDGLRVGDAVDRDLPSIPPQLTLDTFADRLIGPSAIGPALPVVRDDRLVGLVAVSRLRRLGRRAWPTTRAEDVMVEPPELPILGPDESLLDAVLAMRRSGLDGLPVVSDDGLLGVLTRHGIAVAVADRRRAGEAP